MLVTPYPAMCRTDLLNKVQSTQFRDLLSEAANHDVTGLRLQFYNDGENLHLLAKPLVLLREDKAIEHSTHTKWPYNITMKTLVRDFLFDLMQNRSLGQELEELDKNFHVFTKEHGIHEIYVFDGCAICNVQHPVWQAAKLRTLMLQTAGHAILLPRLCTIILSAVASKHEALMQVAKVRRALATWKAINGFDGEGRSKDLPILTDPPSDMILGTRSRYIA